jgi:hypothetical protein
MLQPVLRTRQEWRGENVHHGGTFDTWGTSPNVHRALVRSTLELLTVVEDDVRKHFLRSVLSQQP